MTLTLALEYTPVCPTPGVPFTETSFTRRSSVYQLDRGAIAVVLVDLWNIGWDDGPVDAALGLDRSTEFGLSHALRKRQVVETVIAPTVDALRDLGVPIIHCNHDPILARYPQWRTSATEAERVSFESAEQHAEPPVEPAPPRGAEPGAWPPRAWSAAWRERHAREVYDPDWQRQQGATIYPRLDIPPPVRPRDGDLLAADASQLHRLLRERRITTLFSMGFETAHCVQFSPYGMAAMHQLGYLCVLVRDGTATPESAETLDGLWRTRAEVIAIEQRWGYSIMSAALLAAVRSAALAC